MRHVFHWPLALLATAFVFLAYFAPARAETPACQGVNLLAQMKKTDRKAYDALVAEGRTIPNAVGLFWKIERKGSKPSYLLGTMHVADPRVLALPAVVKDAHRRARVVILESDQLLDLTKARIMAFANPDMMMMPAGTRIEDYLTAEQKQVVNSAFTARGAPLSAINSLRPWLAANIAATPCQASRAKLQTPVLDQQLALDAIKHKIPVKGLETIEEQYAALNRMSLEAQVKGLLSAVTAASQMDDVEETTLQLYRTGDLRLLQPLMRRLSKNDRSMPADSYAEFEATMITGRNHVMAERLQPYLDEGGAFVAVGALHLQGHEGLIELLRQQGFGVKPIQSGKK